MTKMKNQKLKRKGRLACTTTQVPAKAQRCQYVIASECEAIQPIEKAGLEQQNAGLTPVKNLFPYFPVLDLLHAHGDSPEERCSSRLVPFAIRTRFAVLLAGVKRVCNAAAFASPFRPLPARAPSVRKSAIPLFPCKRCAFTLAEVLITLAVIGIVAALTLPGLIQNHNEKAWSTAKDLWEKKLTETVRRMNTDGVMTGHDTTEDFMNSFKQYMKVIKTCDNNDLNKCYSPEFVLTGKRDNLEKKYIEDFKTANDLGVSDWNTNTMSFVISDGTTVIAAYNPNCPYADAIEDTGSQVACLSMMIDVNGKKSPNRVGKDILLSNATISTCDNPIGDICFSIDFQSTALDTTLDENKPLDSYRHQTNYFAGALKACSEKNMSLPTLEQLAQIANEIYVGRDGKPINLGATENNNSLQLKNEYQNNPPLTIGDSDIGIPYFASDESPQGYIYARTRYFYYDRTTAMGAFFSKSSSARVICVSN